MGSPTFFQVSTHVSGKSRYLDILFTHTHTHAYSHPIGAWVHHLQLADSKEMESTGRSRKGAWIRRYRNKTRHCIHYNTKTRFKDSIAPLLAIIQAVKVHVALNLSMIREAHIVDPEKASLEFKEAPCELTLVCDPYYKHSTYLDFQLRWPTATSQA